MNQVLAFKCKLIKTEWICKNQLLTYTNHIWNAQESHEAMVYRIKWSSCESCEKDKKNADWNEEKGAWEVGLKRLNNEGWREYT